MNGSRWTKLAKKYLLAELPEFGVRGRLLYHQPVGEVLRGISCQPSSFSSERFSVQVFAQPLYVPTKHLIFGVGAPLGLLAGGAERRWNLERVDEAAAMGEVLERIHEEALPFLSRVSDPRGMAVFLREEGNSELDVNDAEWEAYSWVLGGDAAMARRGLDHLMALAASSAVPWARPIHERAQRVSQALQMGREGAVEVLETWRQETVTALKLPHDSLAVAR